MKHTNCKKQCACNLKEQLKTYKLAWMNCQSRVTALDKNLNALIDKLDDLILKLESNQMDNEMRNSTERLVDCIVDLKLSVDDLNYTVQTEYRNVSDNKD